MHRRLLLELLTAYEQTWVSGALPYPGFQAEEERSNLQRLREFVQRQPLCLERHCEEGHITASALVTDAGCEKVLLTLHAKLNKWLQLGGHVDGDSDVPLGALREAREESGRMELDFFPYQDHISGWKGELALPFDLDIHLIPARKNEPEHFHFDVRFLCRLDPNLPFVISEESKDLRWLSLDEAQNLTNEHSMHRQFNKLQALRAQIFSV
jgi:8-oxo-dGTP pyrophosphatase MutT (NUDIX family)